MLRTPGSEPSEEGLGFEKNRMVADSLSKGDFNRLVDLIAEEGFSDLACEVVLRSMFTFHHVDRATDVSALARTALERNPRVMAALIRFAYHAYPTAERFWLNPNDPSQMLFVDRHGNLISFPKSISTISKGVRGAGERFIGDLRSYTVLSGPESGQTFQNEGDRGIPSPQRN